MTIKNEFAEIRGILKRTTDNLIGFNGMVGRPGAELRLVVGDLNVRAASYLIDGTFADRLLSAFTLATGAGITLEWMDRVIAQLVAETPTELTANSVVQNSLIFALAQEGRIIRATEYKSREDVDATMKRMKEWFDIIKDMIADTMSGPAYQAFLDLAAGITRYLTDVARPLPRMLRYQLAPMPALAASQFIYGDGSRYEELVAENKVVHPAFMPRVLQALSA